MSFSRPEEDIRLDCLKLAVQAIPDGSGADCIAVAQAFFEFVSGATDATPRERILRALNDLGAP